MINPFLSQKSKLYIAGSTRSVKIPLPLLFFFFEGKLAMAHFHFALINEIFFTKPLPLLFRSPI